MTAPPTIARSAPRPAVALALGFAPYLIVSVVHLLAKGVGWPDLDHATKPLLMPMLALPLVLLGRRGPLLPLIAGLMGVLFSWVGDVTIANLPVGLGFFLLAHVAYLVAFRGAFPGRFPRWTPIYALWWVVFLMVLLPSLGALAVPVGVYGLALGAMAAVAARGGPVPAVGGALFVVSDSLLALRLFTPLLQDRASDVLIMASYIAAQGLLIAGVLRGRRRGGRG